jgi:hypothetical protein
LNFGIPQDIVVDNLKNRVLTQTLQPLRFEMAQLQPASLHMKVRREPDDGRSPGLQAGELKSTRSGPSGSEMERTSDEVSLS